MSNKKTNANKKIDISIDGKIISQVAASKFLLIHFDQHLKWNVHVEEINKNITKSVGILYTYYTIIHLFILTLPAAILGPPLIIHT